MWSSLQRSLEELYVHHAALLDDSGSASLMGPARSRGSQWEQRVGVLVSILAVHLRFCST